MYSALTANQETIHKANLEGYNASQIISWFEAVPERECEEILQLKQILDWLNNVFGMDIGHTARLLSILHHNQFHHAFLLYTLTQYREQSFSWSLSTKMIASKLDEVRTLLIFIISINKNSNCG